MQIKDLTLHDIRAARNWIVVGDDANGALRDPLEETVLEPCSAFGEDDYVAYPCVYVTPGPKATALVLLKRVGDFDYGGDYCEFVDGSWRQLGLIPNPNAEPGEGFVASPLENDPSFDSPDHDYRRAHAEGFAKWLSAL